MCHLTAYIGPEIPFENIVVTPAHSLLVQSQHAAEAKLAVNGDAFGIGWYGRSKTPGVYKDVLPAWADDNLTTLCRMVQSHLFVAHVRASTVGETSRQNCHPFSWGKWLFCHNGQVPHFQQIERKLEQALPDALYQARRGSTDSEMIFLTLLANGLEEDPARAFAKTLEIIGQGTAPVKLTCVLSDGQFLWGFRHASYGTAPTLYLSRELKNGGQALASEPLCGDAAHWEMVPTDQLVRLDKGAETDAVKVA
jgi:glutamine amidotransferase